MHRYDKFCDMNRCDRRNFWHEQVGCIGYVHPIGMSQSPTKSQHHPYTRVLLWFLLRKVKSIIDILRIHTGTLSGLIWAT